MAEDTESLPAPVDSPLGQQAFTVLDLGDEVSASLRTSWASELPFKNRVGSVWLHPLLGAILLRSNKTIGSSLQAGGVFIATARPGERLMPLGVDGVGSAVMGATGIVRHARFVPARAATAPVMAPVFAFMTLSAMLTAAGLSRVEEELKELSGRVKDLADRTKAGHSAALKTAVLGLWETHERFEKIQKFTPSMTSDLAAHRTTVRKLHDQYEQLAARELDPDPPYDAIETAMFDINLLAVSKIARLEAGLLHLYMTHGESPELAESEQNVLLTEVKSCRTDFRRLLDRNPLESHLASQAPAEGGKVVPSPLRGESGTLQSVWRFVKGLGPKERKRKETRDRIERLLGTKSLVAQCSLQLEESSAESLVFFRDRGGNGPLMAYRTRDLPLPPAEEGPTPPGRRRRNVRDRQEVDTGSEPSEPVSIDKPATGANVANEATQPTAEETDRPATPERLEADLLELVKTSGLLHQETAALGERFDVLRDEVAARLDASDERAKEDLAEFRGEVQSGFAALGDGFRDESSALREKLAGVDTRLKEADARVEKVAQDVLSLRSEAKVRERESRRQIKALLWLAGIGLALGAGAVVWLVFILGAVNA